MAEISGGSAKKGLGRLKKMAEIWKKGPQVRICRHLL
jgi:hypothetical protein